MFPGFNFTVKNIKLDTATGSSAGFEGAWFFNPYIGIGGRLRITNVPVTLDSEHYFANHEQIAADESIQPAAMDIYTFGAGAYFSYPFTNRWLFGSKLLFDSQYSPGDNIHAHSVQQADEGAATKEIIGIERFNTFGIGTGITATYIATQKLSVRFFTDYDFIPSRTKYRISDESGTNYYKNNRPIHALTLGAAVNIQF